MNPLSNHPRIRRAAYYAHFTAVGALGAIAAWCGVVDGAALPDWYFRAMAVVTFLGGYLGLTAGQNVDVPPADPGDDGERRGRLEYDQPPLLGDEDDNEGA